MQGKRNYFHSKKNKKPKTPAVPQPKKRYSKAEYKALHDKKWMFKLNSSNDFKVKINSSERPEVMSYLNKFMGAGLSEEWFRVMEHSSIESEIKGLTDSLI